MEPANYPGVKTLRVGVGWQRDTRAERKEGAPWMERIPQAIYMTPDELDARIKICEAEAHALPPGWPRQLILKEAAQLRTYADAKRCFGSLGLKVGS